MSASRDLCLAHRAVAPRFPQAGFLRVQPRVLVGLGAGVHCHHSESIAHATLRSPSQAGLSAALH